MADEEQTPPFTPPEARLTLVGHQAAETRLRQLLDQDSLSNGWMIAGPEGIGKATLAYRLARAFLAQQDLIDTTSLAVSDGKTAHLVAQKAHPDLFIAERAYDEKKDRFATEITVDTVRAMIAFMNRSADTGHRVAIVDSADHLNRNAANALLKVLEEPPRNTLVLLLTSAPGRLLPTIRSRCRTLTLAPIDDTVISDFLQAEGISDTDAAAVSAIAAGRPGFALRLASGEGAGALEMVEQFLRASVSGRGLPALADRLSLKSAEPLWDSFKAILLRQLATAATAIVRDEPLPSSLSALSGKPPAALAEAWEKISDFLARGEGLNTNRTQMVLGMGLILRDTLKKA